MTQVQFNPRYEELIIANEHARLTSHVISNGLLPRGGGGGDEAISAHNESEEKNLINYFFPIQNTLR